MGEGEAETGQRGRKRASGGVLWLQARESMRCVSMCVCRAHDACLLALETPLTQNVDEEQHEQHEFGVLSVDSGRIVRADPHVESAPHLAHSGYFNEYN